ncbi:hypothetical protein N9L68_03805 [bacterium]|nr:hypothetical protein [bacterium]
MRMLVGRQPRPPAYQNRGVFEELNFPSGEKLKATLKKRNIRWTQSEIDNVVRKSGARYIYAPPGVYPGKAASHSPDARWGRGAGGGYG